MVGPSRVEPYIGVICGVSGLCLIQELSKEINLWPTIIKGCSPGYPSTVFG